VADRTCRLWVNLVGSIGKVRSFQQQRHQLPVSDWFALAAVLVMAAALLVPAAAEAAVAAAIAAEKQQRGQAAHKTLAEMCACEIETAGRLHLKKPYLDSISKLLP
jgi:hypothetical protein